MLECPELETAKRLLSQESASKSDSMPTSARTSALSDQTSAFKKDGTAVIYETEESPVQIIDLAMPMSEKSTPGSARMQLFFVLGAVQTLPTWILADSGSVQNLVDETVYKKLPYQPPIRDLGDCRVIGGNGEPLNLKGFTVLPVTLGTKLLWHEFGVVPNLMLEVLIYADVLMNHQCSLLYLKDNQKRLMFGNENCKECERFQTNPEFGASAGLKFVDRNPKRRRNRCKIGANFVATLPKTDEHEQNKTQLEPDTVHVKPEVVHFKPEVVHFKPKAVHFKPEVVHFKPEAENLRQEKNLTCEQQTEKLQVLSDLRVSILPIPDHVRKRLVEVIKENLDAFAASPIDLGRTSVVVHTIKTNASKPFRHTATNSLRTTPVPRARSRETFDNRNDLGG